MKYVKRHPIIESNHHQELIWEEKFIGSDVCNKIIEDLNDALVSLSDDRSIFIEAEIDNVPLISIYCEIKNNVDLRYTMKNNISSIRDFEDSSKEIVEIGYIIEEGIKRSNVDYLKISICKLDTVSNDKFDGPSLLYSLELDKKLYPLGD
jgi:hypothetical protein